MNKLKSIDTLIMNYGNSIFGKKWRVAIIYALRLGSLRFSQIKTQLPGCSVKVLSESLQDMEVNNIVTRKQYQTIPVKVTYELNPHIEKYVHVIDQYRQLMVVHLYIFKENYPLTEDEVHDLNTCIKEMKLNLSSLLESK